MTDNPVRSLHDRSDIATAAALLTEVWGQSPIGVGPLVAFAHAGSYVAAAYDGEVMVGAIAGFCGVVDGEWRLHSHVAAVAPAVRRSGVGLAMKWHQHDWCVDRGIPVVTWTFDPLVRRNGRFNLRRLGAVGVGYHENLYGPMDDAINRGDETDRVLMRWEVGSGRVAAARAGTLASPAGDLRRVATPDDIEAIRPKDPAAAHQWRLAVRAGLVDGFAQGRSLIGVDDRGDYLLGSC